MKAIRQIITQLNMYLRLREAEARAKEAKEDTRDVILNLLPPTTTSEWEIPDWGAVSYKRPKDSLAVDLELLAKKYPKAYAACVSTKPNAPRFCVNPDTEALVAALKNTSMTFTIQEDTNETIHPTTN